MAKKKTAAATPDPPPAGAKPRRGRKPSKPKAPVPPAAAPDPSVPAGVKDYRLDPAGYAADVLENPLTPMQQEVCRLMLTPPYRVLVACGHAVGKTNLGAVLTSWFFDNYPEGAALTTAPTHRDVVDLLWKQVRGQRMQAGLGGMVGNTSPEMRGGSEHNWAKGFTSEKGESFSGRHEKDMLFEFDEATGIDPTIWEVAQTMFKSRPGHHWVCFFNPLNLSCQAYKEWQRDDWHHVQMSCLDHPNITAALRGLPEPISRAVSIQQVHAYFRQWTDPVGSLEREANDIEWPPGSGTFHRPGPQMDARVLGRWPSGDLFGVWSRYAWQMALQGLDWAPTRELNPEGGCDVAYTGVDYTVIHFRWGPKSYHHERHNGWSPKQTANRLKVLCAEAASRANAIRPPDAPCVEPEEIVVKVDADGLGINVIDNAGSFNFRPVCGSGTPMRPEQYYNKRTESWFQVCQLAKDGLLSVAELKSEDKTRIGDQVLAPTWAPESKSGLCLLEYKELTKKRLACSPDDADAFILAYCPLGNVATLAWQIQAMQGAAPSDPVPWVPPSTTDHMKKRNDPFSVAQVPDDEEAQRPPNRMWNFGR